jgi:hypothetical protein
LVTRSDAGPLTCSGAPPGPPIPRTFWLNFEPAIAPIILLNIIFSFLRPQRIGGPPVPAIFAGGDEKAARYCRTGLIQINELPIDWAHECFVKRRHKMFKNNVGTMDRTFRILLGLVLIGMVFFGPQTPWGWVGLVPLLTGLFKTCPIYSLFGINSCPR